MKQILLLLAAALQMHAHAQYIDHARYPVYEGKDLGLTYTKKQSAFRIWAPAAETAELLLYAVDRGGEPLRSIPMQKGGGGTWLSVIEGDLAGTYYAFRVRNGGAWSDEVPDPYARLVGTNGRRAMVGDPSLADPPGWKDDKAPVFRIDGVKGGSQRTVDAVVYELHVRDASIHPSSGITRKGKFLGLTETDTRNKAGHSTGLSHLRELGVTHVHLLPSYDFYTVDESRLDSPQYNWGYDPLNYNTPEGSYSTNPSDGLVRVREFKQLVQSFHKAGLRVVMDVVYNHTMFAEKSWFHQLVPGYYYRHRPDGSFSDATACGNETASERPMMRKFILESVLYWVNEFHVDGFRFDLMGVHDIETMNLVSRELHAVKPDILLYGEGWTAGASPLPDSLRAIKKNAHLLDRIAVFSDDLRDGIKGSVFVHEEGGFASGRKGLEPSIRFGVVASTKHPQVDYSKVNYSKAPYSSGPHQTIGYCECHDNHNLWDKLKISNPNASDALREEMHRLAMTIVITSQGIPFLHAGSEFRRSKQGVENSFNSGDGVNAIDWDMKSTHSDLNAYVRRLLQMRRKHPAFRLGTTEEIARQIRFLEGLPDQTLGYELDGKPSGDSWKRILVLFNGSGESKQVAPPKGAWKTFVRSNRPADGKAAVSGSMVLAPHSATILYRY
jgi:pullulanase